MRAKLLQHPAATAGRFPARPSKRAEVLADSGLPPWFYWLTCAGFGAALVLGVPFNLPVLLLLWVYYFHCTIWSPERAIFVFLMTMVLLKTMPIRGIPLLPGMNSDTLFVVTLAICAMMSRDRQPQPPVPNPFIKPIGFMVLLLSVSAVLSFGMGSAMHHSFARGWRPYSGGELFSDLKSDVFYMFLAPIAFRLLWNRKQLVTALSVVSIYTAYIAIEALGARAVEAVAPAVNTAPFLRAGGSMFREPNALGGFLAIAGVAIAPAALSRNLGMRLRILVAATAVASLAGLVYSFSRGAWVAALAGFLAVSFLRGAKGMLVVILLAMTATMWLPQAVIDRYEHTVRTKTMGAIEDVSLDNSTEGRIERWKAVPGMFWDAPVIGHGYKAFPRTYGVLNEKGGETGPHSTITAIIVEEGLLGIIAYGWLMLAMFWGAYRLQALTDDSVVKAIAIGVAAAVPTLFVLDLSGNRLVTSGVMGPMWIMIGGVARQYVNLRYADADPPPTRTRRSSS